MISAKLSGMGRNNVKICGDDLISLTTHKCADEYEKQIKGLGCVVNKTKSFRSKSYGVFCERLVKRTDNRIAEALTYVTITEASAAKMLGGLSDNKLDSIERVRELAEVKGPAKRLATITMNNLKLRKLPSGPVSLGGNGVGKPTLEIALGTLMYGRMKTVTKSDIELSKEYRLIFESDEITKVKQPGVIDFEEVSLNIMMIRHGESIASKSRKNVKKEKPLNFKTHRIKSYSRLGLVKFEKQKCKNNMTQVCKNIINASNINSRSKRYLLFLMKKYPLNSLKFIHTLISPGPNHQKSLYLKQGFIVEGLRIRAEDTLPLQNETFHKSKGSNCKIV
jgi:hypothetical protein